MAKTIIFNQNTEKFLKKNKIKTIFVKEMLKWTKRENIPERVEEIKNSDPTTAILLAFTWGTTTPEKPEKGYIYWNGIYKRAIRFERDLIQIPK